MDQPQSVARRRVLRIGAAAVLWLVAFTPPVAAMRGRWPLPPALAAALLAAAGAPHQSLAAIAAKWQGGGARDGAQRQLVARAGRALRRRARSVPSRTALRAGVQQLLRDDYRAGRTVAVDAWSLSASEVYLAMCTTLPAGRSQPVA